ncbi:MULTISPECIES: DNA polymerase III subunit delta [Planococcus]|uniref:DNA polymerase III subunit delta n=2 Tax=Planococcus TaxID=1372 RepID=A0A1G8IU10_9BACL|nr:MULTISPECIES: DNA polymerase III subunit delta [Planococcus]ETP68833.1 DNA polymerase III subunit delta [Planococcus glaciei CHR43]MBX0315009.1 DNA polymerase III subunit delta [Planococcus glaciei]MDN7226893.1 DNA polymerase III subunit delta [Planococcus sp. N064]QKX51790.1 DNA polymerase III subunit delta [Planococcus glaciei]SDI22333.1 DNA polymerase III, delta subunit [Planococcus glaciei]
MITSIWKAIRNGQIDPVYVITGTESYFIEKTLDLLKTKLTDGEPEFINFDLDEVPVDYVIEEADTIPFFSDRKLIIAKNASFLKAAERGKEKIDHNLKALEAWLENPPSSSVTVFVAPYEKLDERKKITKLIKQHAVMVEAKALQANDLEVWVQHEAKQFGKHIEKSSAQRLIEMAGTNLTLLSSEIEKMSLYLGAEEEITDELIVQMTARTLEQDAFKMLQAYLDGNISEALSVYYDLIRQKEEPVALTALLASQIRFMVHVYYLQKKGYHAQQISKQLKAHPYRVKLLVEKRQQIPEQRLLEVLNDLAEIDLQLKTQSGNRERILEFFLMKRKQARKAGMAQ